MAPRRSPKNTYSRALEVAVQAYLDDKRIAEALDAGKAVDWAEQLRKVAASHALAQLVEQMFMQDPDSPHCLNWAGSLDVNGYPRIRVFGRLRAAPRVVWQLFNHQHLAPNVVVKQTCNNKVCIRKEHLYLDLKAAPLFRAKAKLIPPPDATIPPVDHAQDTGEGGGAE